MFMTLMFTQPTETPPGDPLFLDDYPGVNLSLSLRQLTASYSGNKLRVRRDTDDEETFIGLVSGELDIASLLSFCGSGSGYVVVWYGETNGLNASQFNPSLQPQIVNNGTLIVQNGKPSIYFNGSNYLDVDDHPLINTNAFTIISVGAISASGQNIYSKAQGINANTTDIQYQSDRDGVNTRFQVSVNTSYQNANLSGISSPNLAIYVAIREDTLQYLSLNNNETTRTINSGSVNVKNAPLRIGARWTSRRLIGNVSELLYYPLNTSSNLVDMRNAINSFYSCY